MGLFSDAAASGLIWQCRGKRFQLLLRCSVHLLLPFLACQMATGAGRLGQTRSSSGEGRNRF